MRKYLYLALVMTIATPAMAVGIPLTVVNDKAPILTVGYSPATTGQESALSIVLSAINGAKRNVDIAAYSFTSKPIAAALVSAKNRGVSVRVVADEKANNSKYTAVTYLANQGVPVRLDSQYAIMHNKFMVVDGNTVQTGSFNNKASAVSRNAENVLLIQAAPALAKNYQTEFNRLWNESATLGSRY